MTLQTALLGLTAFASAVCLAAENSASVQRLIDRYPFDRITLSAKQGGTAIDVQLLDLPNRQVPQPLPTGGSLEVRLLSEPTKLYKVDWSDLARIDLYEQLILQEVQQFTTVNQLEAAYENLAFLHRNYPLLAGLSESTEAYLQRDAAHSYTAGRYDQSLAILSALHDLNPQRRGLAQAVIGVSNRMIAQRLEQQDLAGARQILDSLRTSFPDLDLSNIATWEARFLADAQAHLQQARQAIAQGDYRAARNDVRQAIGIASQIPGAGELLAELDRLAPQTVVAVSQLSPDSGFGGEWATERVAPLLTPHFVELVDVGIDGSEYTCQWAKLTTDDTGLKLQIALNDRAGQSDITPASLSLALWRRADPRQPTFAASFAAVFQRVELVDGSQVVIRWRYPPVQPLALLRFPLSQACAAQMNPAAYTAEWDDTEPSSVRFRRSDKQSTRGPMLLVESLFPEEETAVAGLLRGECDLWEDVPPWQADALQKRPGVVVTPYRLPTVHVLLANFTNPLLQRREFRRALCYGLDRNRILTEVLGTDDQRQGFRLLSGPLPAGVTYGDPLGYAYDQNIQPLAYEPRLAVVLHDTAQAALSKIRSTAQAEKLSSTNSTPAEVAPQGEDGQPLILVHPADPASQAVCRLIKQQLDAVGIPITLRELSAAGQLAPDKWDLRYGQLYLAEPLVDARRLLGPGGLAGRCSPAMNVALTELDQATNWKYAREQLHRIHQIAFDDLPVIPLWQTVKYLAYRRDLTGIPDRPLTLYQQVDRWQKNYQLEGRTP